MYKLEHQPRDGYVYFKVTGEDSLETSLAYFQEVFDIAISMESPHILIDEYLDGDLSTIEMYELTEKIPDMQKGHVFKVAFVDSQAKNPAEQEFGVTVVRNRGMDGRKFGNIDDAVAWLKA